MSTIFWKDERNERNVVRSQLFPTSVHYMKNINADRFAGEFSEVTDIIKRWQYVDNAIFSTEMASRARNSTRTFSWRLRNTQLNKQLTTGADYDERKQYNQEGHRPVGRTDDYGESVWHVVVHCIRQIRVQNRMDSLQSKSAGCRRPTKR